MRLFFGIILRWVKLFFLAQWECGRNKRNRLARMGEGALIGNAIQSPMRTFLCRRGASVSWLVKHFVVNLPCLYLRARPPPARVSCARLRSYLAQLRLRPRRREKRFPRESPSLLMKPNRLGLQKKAQWRIASAAIGYSPTAAGKVWQWKGGVKNRDTFT